MALMERGRANPSDYRVLVPQKVLQYSPSNTSFNDYISFFCRAATLPSPSNSIMQVKGQERVGIARNVITGRNYGSPAVFTFTERSDLLIYSTLKGWMDSTVLNSQDSPGLPNPPLENNLRVQYYNDSVCDIIVQKLEPQFPVGAASSDPGFRGHRLTGEWTLKNSIPLAIEQSTLTIESADSALDFTISIAFETFDYQKINSKQLFGASTVPNAFTS